MRIRLIRATVIDRRTAIPGEVVETAERIGAYLIAMRRAELAADHHDLLPAAIAEVSAPIQDQQRRGQDRKRGSARKQREQTDEQD